MFTDLQAALEHFAHLEVEYRKNVRNTITQLEPLFRKHDWWPTPGNINWFPSAMVWAIRKGRDLDVEICEEFSLPFIILEWLFEVKKTGCIPRGHPRRGILAEVLWAWRRRKSHTVVAATFPLMEGVGLEFMEQFGLTRINIRALCETARVLGVPPRPPIDSSNSQQHSILLEEIRTAALVSEYLSSQVTNKLWASMPTSVVNRHNIAHGQPIRAGRADALRALFAFEMMCWTVYLLRLHPEDQVLETYTRLAPEQGAKRRRRRQKQLEYLRGG